MPDAENAILEIGGLANERAEEKFKDGLVSPGLAINKNFHFFLFNLKTFLKETIQGECLTLFYLVLQKLKKFRIFLL